MKKPAHRKRESGETIMKMTGWVLLGGVGLLAAACGGKGVNNVGELNSVAGYGGSAGSSQGSTAGKQGAPDGNTGGSAGSSQGSTAGKQGAPDGNTGGSAGQPQTGEVFFEGPNDVRAIVANSTTLYWVEHGSEDSLGNFQNDGRLLARDFDSEDVRVLADDLPGAVDVAVTGRHAYIYVDQYIEGDGPRRALVRMTLAGADYALVRVLEADNSCFVSVDGAAYFVDGTVSIFRVSDEDSTPTLFLEQGAMAMAVDETTLFYLTFQGEIWQAPLTTGVATRLSTHSRGNLQTSGAHLYGIDSEDPLSVFLARMPKDGGSWERLAPRHEGDYGGDLQIVGDLFFHDLQLPEKSPGCRGSLGCWKVAQGNLNDTAAAQIVLELPKTVTGWVGTTAGVFWIDGGRIRHLPLAVE
jgi:hypothetical protein